jgi:hypothetical protein
MTKTNPTTGQAAQTATPQTPGGHTNLSHRYGRIGIQAVAAAARYSSARKAPTHAQAGLRIDQRFVESAG